MKRIALRLGAVTAAAALTLMSMAPAQAAAVSQASATALRIAVAGNGTDTGAVRAVHDGTKEDKGGSVDPPISVVQNQRLANVGVLAQDATARVDDQGRGTAYACAGVAGNGGSVAEVGDSSCVTPGEPLGLRIANLDLTGVRLANPDSALAPLNQLGDPLVQQALGPLTNQISTAIAGAAGDFGIQGTFGALEARCVAGPDNLEGTANLADSRLVAVVPGQEPIVLANLPVNPPPNTDLLVDLDVVLTEVNKALRTTLTEMLGGALEGLTAVNDALIQAVIDNVVTQVAPQLQPLSDNVLKVVLNEQRRAEDSITVTALSLDALPAAEQFAGAPLVSADLAEVSCGPNGRYDAPAAAAAPAEPAEAPGAPAAPEVPTTVASGVAGGSDWGSWALVALLLTAVSGGVVGYRRSLAE